MIRQPSHAATPSAPTRRADRPRAWHPLAGALAAGAFFALPGHAQLPVGPTVVSGSAAINTAGTRMTVTNSPSAILNWQSFSIGAPNGVHFQQQNTVSQVLNRVTGSDPSQILGSLSSNGRVWLINPHGVLFGQGARIDVAGLVASTLDISNADFLANRFNFATAEGAPRGTVLNQGEIRTTFGGRVWLLGDTVRNEGLVDSPNGNIVLAAGKSIELIDSGMPNVIVRVTAPQNEAANLGTLMAAGGSVDLHGGIVNQEGIVRADSVGTDALGRIVLKASQAVTLGDTSQTQADGQRGGEVVVEAGEGTTLVAGRVSARGENGAGGKIHLLGQQVGVYGQAVVDASGATGGGEVLVGGDYQGKNPAIRNAWATFIGRDATLTANALAAGDGGRVIVWSDDATRVYGTIAARGGTAGGNGGFIETSGGWLDVQPKSIDLTAPIGLSGMWLLDPNNILIDNQPNNNIEGNPDIEGNQVFTSTGNDSVVNATVIESALTSGANVTIQTGEGDPNTQDGNITVAANIRAGSAPPLSVLSAIQAADSLGSLTLSAHNDIVVNQNVRIESLGGPMNVTFISNSDGENAGSISMRFASSIVTNGGNIVLRGGGTDQRAVGSPAGVQIENATLDAGSGSIELRGLGLSSGGQGVQIGSGSRLSADRIRIDGKAETTSARMAGVEVIGATVTGRDIHIVGQTNSLDPTAGFGKWWSVRIVGNSLVEGRPNGNLLIEGTDGYAGGQDSRIIATGSTPITLRARWVDLIGGVLGSSSPGDDYSGNITLAGDWAILEQRGAGRPNIETSGQVIFQPLGPNGDLVVDLDRPVFSSRVRQILIGNSNTRNLYFTNWNYISSSSAGPISVASPVELRADQAITIGFSSSPELRNSGITSSAPGDAITVVTGGVFDNRAGSIALSAPNGRWLVYAADPTTSTEGFPNSTYSKHYNQPFVEGSTPAYAVTGNWFLYSVAPTLTVTPGSQTVTYGDATPAAFSANLSGFIDGDTAAEIGGSAAWVVAGATSSSGLVTAGTHDVAFNGGLASVLGYRFADDIASTGELTVNARSLTASYTAANKTYDGTTAASVSASSVDVIRGDTVGFSQSAAFRDKDVGLAKPVDVSAIALTGADAANYVLTSPTATATADIGAKNLTPALTGTVSKVFDGTALAALTPQNYTIDGLVSGDAVTFDLPSTGRFDTPAVGTGKTVTATSLALSGGTDAVNYTLTASEVSGAIGTITAPLETRRAPIPEPPPSSSITVLPPAQQDQIENIDVQTVNTAVQLALAPVDPGRGAVTDQSVGVGLSSAGASGFGPLNLSLMSRDQMQQVIDSRKEFKKKLFADAIYKLEQDPSLAEIRPCASLADASSGMCRMTDAQRNELAAKWAGEESRKSMRKATVIRLPQIERKIAVLFGANQYADASIPPLENAIPDAEVVGRLFADKLGYEVRVVRNPTKADIVRTLNELSAEARGSDSVIVYYAGHGYQIDETGAGYWLPSDASANDPAQWISNTDVSKMLSGIGAKQLAMVSDSCYSGTFAKEQRVGLSGKEIKPDEVLTRRTVVVMSSGGDEPVADEGRDGHSIFAWHLIRNLRSVDNWQPGTTIFEQVQRDVNRSFPQTPQYGAAVSAGHQTGGDYLFEYRQLEGTK